MRMEVHCITIQMIRAIFFIRDPHYLARNYGLPAHIMARITSDRHPPLNSHSLALRATAFATSFSQGRLDQAVLPRGQVVQRAAPLRPRCGTSQHGLSSKKMTLIASNCGATRSLSIKWP